MVDHYVALGHRVTAADNLSSGKRKNLNPRARFVKVDVRALDCDFYTFSGHKLYGPTGIGVLYGKFALLDAMPPYQGGGDMISRVTFEKTSYNALPFKFEAGTPNIAGTIGLAAAIDYVEAIGLDAIAAHENDLLDYATRRADELSGGIPWSSSTNDFPDHDASW